ncbi:uncharacterized protein [Periplaneta americana]|uniref:uncharacterized protein n=1 Tax=Periplaneta americana TaxID=6978 RepID=UPI0037E77075
MASSTVFSFLALACAAVAAFSLQGFEPYDKYHREVRETHKRYPQKCCGKEPFTMSEVDRAALKACKKESGTEENDELDKHMKAFSCSMECLGKHKEVLDKEGYVAYGEFTSHYLQMYPDKTLHELTDQAMKTCISAANSKAKELGPDVLDGRSCNRATGLTAMCIRYMVETHCPEAEKTNSTDCGEVRVKLEDWNKRTNLKYL